MASNECNTNVCLYCKASNRTLLQRHLQTKHAHVYTCKFLLNILGRAVEQLAVCLVKSQQSTSKYNSHAKPVRSAEMYYNEMMLNRVYPLHDIVTPIVPPTECGIRPVPNRNL